MSYEQFYGLKEQPFSNAPDSRFYYNSDTHSEAILRTSHVIDTMKGLAVVVGGIGAGKTLLARKMIELLDTDEYESGLLVIVHGEITSSWLLKRIALHINVDNPSDDKVEMFSQIYRRLIEIYEEKRKAVILIDEANMLQSKEIMEQLRGLLNLEVPGQKLLSIVLFGIPTLDDCLAMDPPLLHRIAVRFTLNNLSPDATREYIRHRLKVAGGEKELFTPEALKLIFNYSSGVPRFINTVCDNALLEGFLTKRDVVEAELIDQVAVGLGLKKIAIK